jgi:hypothetical protein
MAAPVLLPISTTSVSVLPSTGSYSDVNDGCPFKVYSTASSHLYSPDFISGAVEQVSFCYRKLGGDVLDIELVPYSVYNTYEEAVLTYSEILNYHQAKNVMGSLLGQPTASFDSLGNITGSLSGSSYAVQYPRFRYGYAEKVAQGTEEAIAMGGQIPIYSGSVDIVVDIQDYDLQDAIASSSDFSGSVGNKRIKIHKVFFRTPASSWRFFGLFGSPTSVYGDGSFYGTGFGSYSDNTLYEMVPVWEHKLLAMKYADSIRVRCSNYSYELRNNKLRIYPIPTASSINPTKIWFIFSIADDVYENDNPGQETDINGVNNVNNAPFSNLPYSSINSMGKNWVRRYSLALCKEILGNIRSKFATLPIPNASVTLNGPELLSQAKEEQTTLKEELRKLLDELTYAEISKKEAEIAESTNKSLNSIPLLIFIG